MTDDEDRELIEHDEVDAPKKRGRPKGSTNAPKPPLRRNYAAELKDLEGRVALMVRILGRCREDDALNMRLVEIALECVQGEGDK